MNYLDTYKQVRALAADGEDTREQITYCWASVSFVNGSGKKGTKECRAFVGPEAKGWELGLCASCYGKMVGDNYERFQD